MFEKLKKILKRNCKNQGRNITTCTVVAFLLSCSVTMAKDGNGFGYDFNFDGSDIKITEHHVDTPDSSLDIWTFDKNDTTQFDGKFAEDEWDKETQTFTQNGAINLTLEAENCTVKKSTGTSTPASSTIGFDEDVYGLKLTTTGTPFNFIQNGTIAISYAETEIKHTGSSKADITRKNKGNGLVIADNGITVDVNGNIKGEVELYGATNVEFNDSVSGADASATATTSAEATNSANGIYSSGSQSIGNITGSISGFAILTGGNDTTATAIATPGSTGGGVRLARSSATASAGASIDSSANGIYMESSRSTTIGNIAGSINGFAILTGGNNTTADASGFDSATATATASAEATNSANGIYSSGSQSIGDITGSINGFAVLTGGNNASAIADTQTVVIITATATATADSSANGIYSSGSQSIGDITGSINGFAVLTGGNNASAIVDTYINVGTTVTVTATATADSSANGIYSFGSQSIGDITGSINGFAILQRGSGTASKGTPDISITANTSANGIYFNNSTNINNSGKIQGYVQAFENDGTTTAGIDTLSFSGNGIAIGTAYNDKLNNKGVIAGSDSAVAFTSLSGTINNYGIMAGKNILGNGDGTSFAGDSSKFTNYGLKLILETQHNDKTHSLVVNKIDDSYKGGIIASNQNGSGYTIWNADKNGNTETKSIALENTKEYDKHIFNGVNNTVSTTNGAINNIKNSVINAFETAVNMENGELSVTDTIINGGANLKYTYDKDKYDPARPDTTNPENMLTMHPSSPAVKFTGNNNNFSAYGETVINGDIKIESTGNQLTLGLHSQLNGDIIGKDTDDDTILNLGVLGDGETKNTTLNIQDDITNIKNINIENSVTFYENISVTGVDEITIKKNGVLNLRLAKSNEKKDVTIYDQEYTNVPIAEHAFDKNSGFITITGLGSGANTGTLNFVTNGIGKEIYVPFDNNIKVENTRFDVSSGIDKITVGDDFIFIGAGKDLDDIVNPDSKPGGDGSGDGSGGSGDSGNSGKRYEQLNKIYKSIYSSGGDNLDALRNILSITAKDENYDGSDKDEQLKSLMNYLNGVYSHSPYAFSSELSRKSVGMFRDIVTDNSFIPNYKKWLVMGGLTHQDAGTTDTYYGKNYHGFDTGTADVDADSKLTGAYVLAKYGYSDKVTLGITAGGNKGDSELSTDSKVKDNAGYVGGFIENYRGNLTLKAGAGIQYSEFDADRKTINDSYSDKYSDMAYDIYGSLRYSLPLDNNFFLEPYGVLSYTHVDQEGADEGSKALAIETDDKKFDYTTVKAGVDLKKVIPTEKAKHTLTAGVSYERFLDGDDEEYITGRMKGGTDFDILVAHKNKHQISLNAKYEIERENGILFNLKGEYSFQRDEHNNEAKNKTAGEWTVGAGIGYKF